MSENHVPSTIRIGGAFAALGIVLLIFTFVEVATTGWMVPFQLTPRFLMILAAAALVGGFATAGVANKRGIGQVVALVIALLLVVGGRLVPNPVLTVMDQWWLPAYGLLALGCSVVIRQAAIR
ncbi:hypothetical protein [Corynebacterium freiburgense]|uniref:hypothetical protein n=1 Tax=Corynebacterium freiburgense TaxID=556548 RepID=UPI0003FAF510|nr:hypothetical protein [Corynebacterium freiburgense]WJZ02663.1 hypothetical protein CFREI_06885 [Corynebacterium freiburgense]